MKKWIQNKLRRLLAWILESEIQAASAQIREWTAQLEKLLDQRGLYEIARKTFERNGVMPDDPKYQALQQQIVENQQEINEVSFLITGGMRTRDRYRKDIQEVKKEIDPAS